MNNHTHAIEDIKRLRTLAAQVREAADDPENARKREQWLRHTRLEGDRPMLFVSPEGAWAELLPERALTCETPVYRELERELSMRLKRRELLHDDVPIERDIYISKAAIPMFDGWGVSAERITSAASAKARGAWRYKRVIESPSDWKKLKKPDLIVDEAGAEAKMRAWADAVGDLLNVSVRGACLFDFHLIHLYCDFRGMESMFTDLVDEENMVMDVMEFFTQSYLSLIDECEARGLISLNNDQTYHYTGGLGYSSELPKPGFKPARPRAIDVWGAAEAQEFHTVSPEMHEKFALRYERRILSRFGLNGYGCCDDLTNKLDSVLKIPNLRRVALCPWADTKKCAERLKDKYILTWKPNPAHLAADEFDSAFVEEYLFRALSNMQGCHVEIILRDTHTCRNDPARFPAYIRAARNAIVRATQA